MPDRTVLVGFGRAHRALLRFLVDHDGLDARDLLVADQKDADALDPEGRELLRAYGVPYRGGPGYLAALGEGGRLFLTPGMRKDRPEVAAARARGAVVTGEAAFACERLPARSLLVGITGSAGKTTTTTLVERLLKASGVPAEAAGNIGRPLVELLPTPPAVVVAELSSFQLELFSGRGPDVGAVLNLHPNHLDVHGTFEAYRQAKMRLVATAPPGAPIVVPAEDPTLVAEVRRLGRRPVLFGERPPEEAPGAWVAGGVLRLATEAGEVPLVEAERLAVPGRHNVQNVLAAALLAALAGGDVSRFGEVLVGFRGVPHRLEEVARVGGVRYVNDSIATSPDRTLAALAALPQPVVLIAGGYDKGLPWERLGAGLPGRVRAVVAMGQCRQRVAEVAQAAGVPVSVVGDLDEAVAAAAALARPGDAVLLSPAAASYDAFPNFEARGERFRELVRRLAEAGEDR